MTRDIFVYVCVCDSRGSFVDSFPLAQGDGPGSSYDPGPGDAKIVIDSFISDDFSKWS